MSHFERLEAVAWESASAWDPGMREAVFDYYSRILPQWPESDARILPDNARVIDAFERMLLDEERERVEQQVADVLSAPAARQVGLSRTTKALVRLVLVTSQLVTRGVLSESEDPAEPLLRLFEAGYGLMPHPGGLDIVYEVGMTTMPFPARSTIEGRKA